MTSSYFTWVPFICESAESGTSAKFRAAALVAFDFQENELSSDLILFQAAVLARGWADHQEQPVDQNAFFGSELLGSSPRRSALQSAK